MIRRFAELILVLSMLFGVLYGPTVVAKMIKPSSLEPQLAESQAPPPVTLLQAKPQPKVRAVPKTTPPLALCFPIRVTEVHDGDTCKAIVQFEITVRYNNCWAPELKDPLGPTSAKRAKEAMGKLGRLYIDLSDVRNLADLLTFGRVVGEIWLDGETESESAKQVRLKMATTQKNGKLGE